MVPTTCALMKVNENDATDAALVALSQMKEKKDALLLLQQLLHLRKLRKRMIRTGTAEAVVTLLKVKNLGIILQNANYFFL